MELSGRMIEAYGIIENARPKSSQEYRIYGHGVVNLSCGIDDSSYGLTLDKEVTLAPLQFALASTAEKILVPAMVAVPELGARSVIGYTVNKSTIARLGIMQPNTDMEAGWCGYLTLELFNCTQNTYTLPAGMPIATARFRLTAEVVPAYNGKYQNQPARPVSAI